MRKLTDYVDLYRARLATHPFLDVQPRGSGLDERLGAAPGLAHWLFVLPDLLGMAARRSGDAAVRSFLARQRARALGDRSRFIDDLPHLAGRTPELGWLFGPGHEPARAAVERVCQELFVTRTEADLVAFALGLGAVRGLLVASFADWHLRAGAPHPLRCFVQHRAKAPDRLPAAVYERILRDGDRLRARAVAESVTATAARMLDGLGPSAGLRYNDAAWSA